MPEIRRGLAAIKEASERKGGGGDFKPFCPEIRWAAGEEKYVLILTDLEEIQEYLIHEWVKVGTIKTSNGEVKPKYEWFISREDPSIGEASDELTSRLSNQARYKFLGVGVELVPVVEAGRGGKDKVVGFEVATTTYKKKGDDDETVEVTRPNIGVISQSAQNFWGTLSSYQEEQTTYEIPFKVIRRGGDANTTYDFIHFMGQPVDFSNLLDYVDGVSYLSTDEEGFTEMMRLAADAEDDLGSAMEIANHLLAVRVEELSDAERYKNLVSGIEELEQRWGKDKKDDKPARPPRVTRSAARGETSESEAPAEGTKTARGERFAALKARHHQSE